MVFFDSKTLPDSKGKESFFGSYNIPVNVPAPEPKQSTSSKVGGVVKAVAKDLYGTAATIPVRAVQAEELLRTSFFGGTDSKKKAMEFASQPVDIGFGTQVKPLDTSSIGRAAQQTVGDVIKGVGTFAPIGKGLTLAKQLALQGGAYGLGNAMSEGKSVKDTAIDTAVGAASGLVVGKGMSVAGKLFKGTPKEIPTSKVTPEITTTLTKPYVQPKQALKPATKITVPQELPPKVNPITGQAEQVVPTVTSKSETITYPRPQAAPTTPKVEPVPPTPEQVSSWRETLNNDIPNPNNHPEIFRAKTHDEYINSYALDLQSNPAFVERVGLGLEPHPKGAAYTDAYRALSLKNAYESNNRPLIEDLLNSRQNSISGQKLEANKLSGKDNIEKVVNTIKESLYSKLSSTQKANLSKEQEKITRKILDDIDTFKPTKETIDEIFNDIICK